MAEKKLYASLEDWNEVSYEELTSESTMLVNTTGDDEGMIFAIKAGEFKGDKGDKGEAGNVLLPDGLVISSIGYTFLAQESDSEARDALGLGDVAIKNAGILPENVVVGDDRRLMPLGGIMMWAGLTNDIPVGWYLCNGANGTPDLRDRFIVGSGSTYSTGSSGGSKDAVVVSHSHTGSTNVTGAHTHSYTMAPAYHAEEGGNSRANTPVSAQTGSAGNHSHTLIINTAGQSGVNANLPPYYALAFIQFKGYE